MPTKTKTVFSYLLTVVIALLLFAYSEKALVSARQAVDLCTKNLIPSLFPFLVLCELLTKSGLGMRIGGMFSYPAKKLFGISDGGACALFCGALCGFPIGALSALSIYKKGDISKNELSHLLLFCNNTGPGFLVSGVGAVLFGNARFGILLYVCQLLSAFIIGVATKSFFNKKANTKKSAVRTAPLVGAPLFTEAITKAGGSMVNVCAYILFFSILSGVLSEFLPEILVCPLLEISSGCTAAAKLLELGVSSSVCASLCAFVVGWSGLSVHAQTAALFKDEDISLFPYICAKFVQGLLSFVLVFLYFKIFPQDALPVFAPTEHGKAYVPVILSFLMNAAFIFAVIKNLIKKGRKKRFFVIL